MTFIGLDAGGSKTRAIAVDNLDTLSPPPTTVDQSALREVRLPGLNVASQGSESLHELIHRLRQELRIDEPLSTKLLGGFAGIENPAKAVEVRTAFTKHGFQLENVHAINNGELWLKAMGGNGIVLAIETDCVCVGEIQERFYKKGGWRYALGDEGSGFYLGLRAINFARRQAERWPCLPHSNLLATVQEHFGVSDLKEIIPIVHGPTGPNVDRIAQLAPKVLELAAKDDRPALEIVKQGAKLAAEHVAALCMEAKTCTARLALIGGIFDSEHSHLIREELKFQFIMSGLTITLVELGEGSGRQDPLKLALLHHFQSK